MKRISFLFGLIPLALIAGCTGNANQSAIATSPGQHQASMARPVVMELDYLMYLPKEYGSMQKDWPLIIFLHGAGERGSDLNRVKAHGPAKLVEQGKELPFIIVSPQCPADKWWPVMVEQVIALIDQTVESYNVDENRVYLTGLSMGGYGTWAVTATYPERFAAIAPICGGGNPFVARSFKNVPTWAFHGDADRIVPLKNSQEMVDAINRSGGNAKLTVYPGVGHDSWTQTYNNDELYEWFLSHSGKQD